MFNLIFTIFYFCTGRLNRVLFFKSNIHIRISKGSKIKIGKNFSARQGSKIFAKRQSIIEIGDNVFFNHNVHIYSNSYIKIGKNSIFGPNTYVFDHNHKIENKNKLIFGKVDIGSNVWIGASCNILAGTNIGNNSIVAAGSIIKIKIPEKSIYSIDSDTYKIKSII